MDNISKISQLTASRSRRSRINLSSQLYHFFVRQILMSSLLDLMSAILHHSGDGKLIIHFFQNCHLLTLVDLCSHLLWPQESFYLLICLSRLIKHCLIKTQSTLHGRNLKTQLAFYHPHQSVTKMESFKNAL